MEGIFVVYDMVCDGTMLSMNSELVVRNRGAALDIHCGKSNLLIDNMKFNKRDYEFALSNKNVAFDIDHAPNIAYFGSVALAAIATPVLGLGVAFAAFDTLGLWGLGITLGSLPWGFLVPSLAANLFERYDAKRLDTCMVSSKSKDRIYYTNRVLNYLLNYNPDRTVLLNNPYILGYALWFDENLRQVRNFRLSNKPYRTFFAKMDMDIFEADVDYLLYVEIAQDMIDGVFEKRAFPVYAGTPEQRRLFRNARNIITKRHAYRSNYLDEIEADDAYEGELSNVQDEKSVAQISNDGMGTMRDIESEWFAIQSDVVQLLKYPMLSDMGEPLVREFYTQLSYVKALSVDHFLGKDFMLAVSTLKTSWDYLLHEAQKTELSRFDDGERKKILMATNLMNIALDKASTPAERQSAYKKAMEQLKGLVVLPKATLAVLEESVSRKEILEIKST